MAATQTDPNAAVAASREPTPTVKLPFPGPRRARIVLAAIVVLMVGGIAAWSLHEPAAPALATSPATRGDLQQTVDATGVIDAYKLVTVGAQASGQIKSLKVELGDTVKKGDLIAEIDSVTQENSLKNAQAALENVRAQRAVQVASLKEAQLAFDRQKTMLAAEATSRADYEAAEASLASIQAQIRALDAQIKQSETELSTAKANLGYTRITAPIDGTVVAVVTEEGRTVNANQSAPTIVKLARLDKVTVNAEISEADVVKIKPGMPVHFTILGEPDHKYQATLRTVNPAPASISTDSSTSSTSSDSSSSTSSTAVYYNALFDVANPDGTLRIDMTAQVSVVLAQVKDALMIPTTALGAKVPASNAPASASSARKARSQSSDAGSADSDTYIVRVVGKNGQPEPRRIKVGLNNGTSVQVLEGLSEGDKVVVGEVAATAKTDSNARRSAGPMMGPPPR